MYDKFHCCHPVPNFHVEDTSKLARNQWEYFNQLKTEYTPTRQGTLDIEYTFAVRIHTASCSSCETSLDRWSLHLEALSDSIQIAAIEASFPEPEKQEE